MKKFLMVVISIFIVSFLLCISAKSETDPLVTIIGIDNVMFIPADELSPKINELNSKLNLTDEQKQAESEIAKVTTSKLIVYRSHYLNASHQFASLKKTNTSKDKLLQQAQLMKNASNRSNAVSKKSIAAFESILTTEQKAVFEDFEADLNSLIKCNSFCNVTGKTSDGESDSSQ